MPETPSVRAEAHRARRHVIALGVVALVVTLTVAAPAVSATPSTAPPGGARDEAARSLVDDILDLLDRTLAGLFGGLGGVVRANPTWPPTSTTTTTAPAVACRNSTNPACGPFRFDPQPAADRPMAVLVTARPATVAAGQTVRFRLTLVDPDGVSHGSSRFFFGESGIAESESNSCTKYGPWDPPAPDPLRAIEVLDVGHTYTQPGTYTAVFEFYPDPFDCVDSVTGRGDRPYASPASGSVTVVVTP